MVMGLSSLPQIILRAFVLLGAYLLIEPHFRYGCYDFSATSRARANLVTASRLQGTQVFRNALTGLSKYA